MSTLLFLFHIRVIDESRDMEMDSNLHPERPVQSGVISLRQLFFTSIFGIAVCLAIAIYAGLPATILAILILAFTTLAWRDFFAKSFFSTRPVLYHIINSPQMILIQWSIYAIYTQSFAISWQMLLQMLLIYNSIFIVEVVRKIKAPALDSADTYSASMGTGKAIYFSIAMVFSGYAIFALLLNGLGTMSSFNLVYGAIVSLMAIGIMLRHKKRNTIFTEKLMVLGIVLYYVLMNVIIYLSVQ